MLRSPAVVPKFSSQVFEAVRGESRDGIARGHIRELGNPINDLGLVTINARADVLDGGCSKLEVM